MLLESLLTAALETGLGLLAEVGLGDELRDLKARLTQSDERKRREAVDRAFARARQPVGDLDVQPLLEHRPFQEAVVSALLDSVESPFNVRAAAGEWIEKYP